jgi:hypothetical protein
MLAKRISASVARCPLARYPLYACDQDRRRKTNGTHARVIEYALDGIPDPELSYRLITHWFDIEAAPVVELAALYHRRGCIEQTGRAVTRRGKRNPRSVKREMNKFPLRKRTHPLNQPFFLLEAYVSEQY